MKPPAIFLATFLSMACAQPLAAQTQPDMVPLEFVEMLSAGPFMGDADIAVGRLPDRLAHDLAPGRDTRIIGSLISTDFTISAIVMHGEPAAVQERLLTRMKEHGWEPLPMRNARGGFETQDDEGDAPALCSPDDHGIQLVVTSHAGDSAAVRLFLGRDGFGEFCSNRELMALGSPPAEVPIPALYAPVGAHYRGGGSTGGDTEGSTDSRLRTDMEPAALLEHYAAQMIDAGWQAGAKTASPEAALMAFNMTDDSRLEWHGVLYVMTLANGERDLYLRVTRDP